MNEYLKDQLLAAIPARIRVKDLQGKDIYKNNASIMSAEDECESYITFPLKDVKGHVVAIGSYSPQPHDGQQEEKKDTACSTAKDSLQQEQAATNGTGVVDKTLQKKNANGTVVDDATSQKDTDCTCSDTLRDSSITVPLAMMEDSTESHDDVAQQNTQEDTSGTHEATPQQSSCCACTCTISDDDGGTQLCYSTMVSNMETGAMLCQIITNSEGHPIDYTFLEVNPAFESV